jgi:peroxiredoxin
MRRIVLHNRVVITGLALFLALVISACAEEGPAVGKRAPDVTLSAPDGRTAKLSDYRGKPVVLHFWATWCGPCIGELPLIADLTARNSSDLTVLAVNCAEMDRQVSSFLSARALALNVMMDRDFLISKTYNVDAIPQTYLIDSEGIIRSVRVGAYTRPELDRDIAALR